MTVHELGRTNGIACAMCRQLCCCHGTIPNRMSFLQSIVTLHPDRREREVLSPIGEELAILLFSEFECSRMNSGKCVDLLQTD